MITDFDKRIININEDDDDFDLNPIMSLYQTKKEIKIKGDDFGDKNFKNSLKRDKMMKDEAELKQNPLVV